MPEYYAIGYEKMKDPNILGRNLGVAKAIVIGAKFNSSSYEKPDILTKHTIQIAGIPQGALIVLLKYSLGKDYPLKIYKANKFLPRERALIFNNSNGNKIIQGIHVSKPEDLEGKIVEVLLQNESPVGIRV